MRKLVQSLHHCGCRTDPPINLPLHSSLTRKQDPEILELLHLGKDLIPNMERAFHPFPAEDHSLGFGGADSHPSRSTLGCESLQSRPDDANRTTSSAKSRDPILRSPNRTPLTPWLRLEILSIKIMNRIGDKGQL